MQQQLTVGDHFHLYDEYDSYHAEIIRIKKKEHVIVFSKKYDHRKQKKETVHMDSIKFRQLVQNSEMRAGGGSKVVREYFDKGLNCMVTVLSSACDREDSQSRLPYPAHQDIRYNYRTLSW